MTICPECKNVKLLQYFEKDSGFVIDICWNCGYYSSDCPAYKTNPEHFKNIVRNDPIYFMRKYGTYQPKGNTEKTTDDETESETMPKI